MLIRCRKAIIIPAIQVGGDKITDVLLNFNRTL